MFNGARLFGAFKLAWRQILRAPAFSAAVVVIIGLGIGLNTAIFSVARAVMLRPLPMTEPDRLVRVRENFGNGADETQLNLSPLTFKRWRESNSVFTDIAAATGATFTLTGVGEAEYVPASIVSHNFFDVLGVKPALGRDFLPEEDQPGAARVVLLSHGFWQNTLGGDPDVLGRTLVFDGEKRTIVGVMPPHFRHPYRAQVWAPIALVVDPAQPAGRYLYAPARLKPGITLTQAHVAMKELCARVAAEFPDPQNPKEARLVPLQDTFVQDSRPRMFAILGAAAFVLLIAGANIASLLLARQVSRATETSVRSALGASRVALLQESLAQSLLLAIAGMILGVILAATLTGPLYALGPMASDATGNALREFDTTVRLDGQVLGVTAFLTLLVGLGFGLVPALRSARGNMQLALKGASRGSTLDRGTRRTLGALVVAEIAVAVVLMVGSFLMVRSFRNLVALDWGFDTRDRLSFGVSFSNLLRPEHEARVAYMEQALERVRSIPGVKSATATTPDLISLGRGLAALTPEGSAPPEARGYFLIGHKMVAPGYFQDFGVRILRGRAFDDTDRPLGPRVAVISESFARHFWPGQNPIGKTIRRGRADDPRPPYEVVGVAQDVHAVPESTDGGIPGSWYVPYSQNPNMLSNNLTFVVHSTLPPETLQPRIRAELARVDPTIAAHDFNTVERLVEDSRVEDRFGLLLVSLFGALGLTLAGVGLYGLLSFQVARRTREFGVRSALGSRPRDTVSLVFRESWALVGAGLLSGIFGAMLLSRFLQSQLHDVPALEPVSYLGAGLALILSTAFATGLPALRAARVEPVVALRED
jgi:putative ABC transport system permease protein